MDIGPWTRDVLRIGYIEIGGGTPLMFDELTASPRIEGYLVPSDEELVGDLWTRDDDVHIILSPETLLHDIEMEESEKSTAKSISECG
jgi:hypothetical protein